MDANTLFQIANSSALVAWLLLIIIPNSKITFILIRSGLLILVFSALYSILIFSTFQPDMMGDFSSLEGVMKLFTNPMGVTVGWIHYLAFDLFVGIWITKEGLNLGISRLWLLPCQLATFMFGPMGLLLFYVVRLIHQRYISPSLIQLD